MNKVKNFFIKIGSWFKNHAPSKRRIIQLYAALLYNANIKGFVTGRIFHGDTKKVCVPGLNCYSCPGAVGACPLGALQNALNESNQTLPYYMLGIVLLFGVIFGRTICGFLCPIGMLQELLYKIKTPKVKKNKVTYILSFLKWAILIVFVIAIPIGFSAIGYANPGFCKYFCPAGTFGGGFMLLLNPNNADMFDMLGQLFTWKTALLVVFIVGSIFFYRFFCRFICPLGLIYGLFNKWSLIGVIVNRDKCTDCGLCVNACKMDIRKVGDMECINCGECINVCPEQAIIWKGSKIFLHEDQLKPLQNNIKIDLISSLPRIDEQQKTEEENVKISAEPLKKSEIRKINTQILRLNTESLSIKTKLEELNNFNSKAQREINLPSYQEIDGSTLLRHSISQSLNQIYNKPVKELNYSKLTTKQLNNLKNKVAKNIELISKLELKLTLCTEKAKELFAKLPEEYKVKASNSKVKKELYDKKKTKIFFITLFSALSLVTTTALVYYNFIAEDPAPTTGEFVVGSVPQNFTVELMNSDSTYTFNYQEFNNKVTVFNFWATWCGPCVAELPHFDEVLKEYKDDVEIIAIGDSYETRSEVEKYINQNFSTFDITFAQDNEGNEVFRSVGGKDSIPYTVVLDKQNVCQFIRNGKVSYEELKEVVSSLI